MRNLSKAACALLVAASPLTVLSAKLQPLDQTSIQPPTQTPTDRVSDPIIVTGTKLSKEAVRTFIRDVAVEAADGQLARWDDPICPRVQGLEANFNAYIEGTIVALAKEIGARVAEPGCKINLVVAFTSEPGDFIASIRNARSDLFDSMTIPDRDKMAASGETVRTWNLIETKGADGANMIVMSDMAMGGLMNINAVRQYTTSSIQETTRQDIDATFITIDLEQIDGKTMQQISAYAAMLALAQVNASKPITAGPTILNLFHSPESAPADFTDWDIAYMRSLYDSNSRMSSQLQRNSMSRMVHAQLKPEEPEQH